jgi:hypothetical protein
MRHILEMEINKDFDQIWVSCSCGWKTEPLETDAERFKSTAHALSALGRAHRQSAEAEDRA